MWDSILPLHVYLQTEVEYFHFYLEKHLFLSPVLPRQRYRLPNIWLLKAEGRVVNNTAIVHSYSANKQHYIFLKKHWTALCLHCWVFKALCRQVRTLMRTLIRGKIGIRFKPIFSAREQILTCQRDAGKKKSPSWQPECSLIALSWMEQGRTKTQGLLYWSGLRLR